jgi:hypothetical protein
MEHAMRLAPLPKMPGRDASQRILFRSALMAGERRIEGPIARTLRETLDRRSASEPLRPANFNRHFAVGVDFQ